MIPSLESLRGVRKLVRTLTPTTKLAADQPIHRAYPSLRASCHWDVITDAGLYDIYASFIKSDGGVVLLSTQAPVVLQCFVQSRIDVICVSSSKLGLSGVFPYWSWRKLFFSESSLTLKASLTLRYGADRRLFNRILNSSDCRFEYFGCDSDTGNLFIAQRLGSALAVLADGRVIFDFSKDIIGFGSTSLEGVSS